MEFNTLLEHFGRSGYNVTDEVNVFMNSKKQIVLRFRRRSKSGEWSWTEQTKYKFKSPSTITDVSNIIHISKSLKQCDDCRTVFSNVESAGCPICSMRKLLQNADDMPSGEFECSLCSTKCFSGMIGKCGKAHLGCGHQMCNGCFDNIKKNGDKFICTDNSLNTRITCPFCRAKENVALH